MGAPRRPGAAPWPGAEDSSAASPQPAPPAAAFLHCSSIQFRCIPPRRSPTSGKRPGIPRSGLPLFSCPATAGLWKSVSRKDHLDMHRRSQAAVNFHSPLPEAALPAPRCSCSDQPCVCVFPHCPPRFPLPLSSCSQALSHTHTHPKLHVRGTRGKAKDEAITPPRDFPRVKGGHATISHHFCKFPLLSEVCRCRGRHR